MRVWTNGGGRAIICSKLLAGRGEVGETAIRKERARDGGEERKEARTSEEEMSLAGKKKCRRKRRDKKNI